MSTVDMLGASVVLGVVREVNGRHIVHVQRGGLKRGHSEFREERAQVDRLFGRLGGGDDLSFTRRQGD
eukprot:1824863-Pleurochrysis_carterae.AAC.1